MEVLLYISLAVVCLASGKHVVEKASDLHYEHEANGQSPFRAAIKNLKYRWEGGVVNFIFESQGLTSADKNRIRGVLREIEDHTKSGDKSCIRFIEKEEGDPVTPVLRINKGSRCRSAIGRNNPITRLTLSESCLPRLNLIHEFMHVLGFHHEHSRPDRDNYVNINISNINQRFRYLFAIRNDAKTQNLSYDFESILQYPPYSFAADPSWPAIYPKEKLPSGMQLGARGTMSKTDVLRIQRYYSCEENTTRIESLRRIEFALHCDFEDGTLCNMTQDTEDDFNWTLGSRGGSTPGTGPNRDFTTGMGTYLYADASNKSEGMEAIMRTPQFEPGQYCLQFALYYYGADIGRFTMYAELPQAKALRFTATASNDQKNQWVPCRVNLNETSSWRLLMGVEVGDGPLGDVAIDDLRIHGGGCIAEITEVDD